MPANIMDEGFEALLKPIQDISRNWEVDLSHYLEQYINYINMVFGNNVPTMNFAQAAVLVQNSANIYSKKVDSLWSIVLQFLESLRKKQENKNEQGEKGEEQGQRRKRTVVTSLQTEDLVLFSNVHSERNLTLPMEKKKQQNSVKKNIVLNAAIKVKPKENTSCNVYHTGDDVMGKKEEFRLHWRISSVGTLHEEFVNEPFSNKRLQIPVEELGMSRCEDEEKVAGDVCTERGSECGDGIANISEIGVDCITSNTSFLPESEPVPESLPIVGSVCEERALAEMAERRRKENLITVDPKAEVWAPIEFNNGIPERILRRRKVIKLPPGEDKNENKRKRNEVEEEDGMFYSSTYIMSKMLMDHYKQTGFDADVDFAMQFKKENQLKKQILLNRRRQAYQDLVTKEISQEYRGDFAGFAGLEPDGDGGIGFTGFNDGNDSGDDDNDHSNGEGGEEVANLEIPLPLMNSRASWSGDGTQSYENEALKVVHEFHMARKSDLERSSDITERVAAWHQMILPKLEAAEERSHFDIHEYGSKILSTFPEGEEDSTKSFEDIVAGQTPEEVSRYFLASLVLVVAKVHYNLRNYIHLKHVHVPTTPPTSTSMVEELRANTYNVEIRETEPGDLAVDCMELKLLSRSRHYEELDDNMRATSNDHKS